MGREMRLVAQMATAPHHGQVQADLAIGLLDGDDVGVRIGIDLHRLLVQHARQGTDAVAQHSRLLEAQLLGRSLHAGFHLLQDFLVPALQEGDGRVHVTTVGRLVDQADAGGAAAADLVQQARTRTVGEVAVLAGAQVEDLLQHLDALAHGEGTGIGTKILGAAVGAAPIVGNLREGVGAELQERVGLVVAEQDVEAGLQRLDQVVFQKQRLGLGADGGGVDLHHTGHHLGNARAGQRLAEVRAHPLAQVPRLAHVQHGAGCVLHPIDAGQRRQRAQKELQFGRALHERCERLRRGLVCRVCRVCLICLICLICLFCLFCLVGLPRLLDRINGVPRVGSRDRHGFSRRFLRPRQPGRILGSGGFRVVGTAGFGHGQAGRDGKALSR